MELRTTRTLGDLMKLLRYARGLSQVELSSALSNVQRMSQSEISRIETGDRMPNAGQLEALLRVLGASEPDCRRARDLALAAGMTDRSSAPLLGVVR